MSAVGRTERIVDINIRKFRQFPREAGIVGLFLGAKPQVLQEQRFAGPERLGHGPHLRPDAVRRHGHGLTEQFR